MEKEKYHGMKKPGVGSRDISANSVALTTFYEVTLKGDYQAAGVGLRNNNTGNINVPLPPGSFIIKAYLYWISMENTTTLSNTGSLNGFPINGTLITSSSDFNWGREASHYFRSDVTAFAQSGSNTVTINLGGAETLLEGASLVIVFSNSSYPTKKIMINDGGVNLPIDPPALYTTTFSGFEASGPVQAKTTFVVADGQGVDSFGYFNNIQVAGPFLSADGLYWDTTTVDVSGLVNVGDTSATARLTTSTDVVGWIAQVFSVTQEPVNVEPTCIRTTKVYDWIFDTNRYRNKTPLPGTPEVIECPDPCFPDDSDSELDDDILEGYTKKHAKQQSCAERVQAALEAGDDIRIECNVPDIEGPDARCDILSVVNGAPGIVRILWTVIVNVQVFNDTTGAELCNFDVPVQFHDEYAMCIPAPLDETNVFCRITDIICRPTNVVFLGNQIELDVTICKDVQVETEVKLEVLAKFCQPRPNDIPIPTPPGEECPPFDFPPQCPSIFPRANCDCQAVADATGTTGAGSALVTHTLLADICRNCTLAQSTWSYTGTNITGQVTTVEALTVNQPTCTATADGGITMTVTGTARTTDPFGNVTNAPYTLVLTENGTGTTDTFSLTTNGVATGTVTVPDAQLVVQDCVTFGDIPFTRP